MAPRVICVEKIINLKIHLFENTTSCTRLTPPINGHFIGGYCSNEMKSACVINCDSGYDHFGSTFRQCVLRNGLAQWSGKATYCESMFSQV